MKPDQYTSINFRPYDWKAQEAGLGDMDTIKYHDIFDQITQHGDNIVGMTKIFTHEIFAKQS